MTQNFGVTQDQLSAPNFVDDHPPIMLPAVLASSGSVQELEAGLVLARVTASGKFVALNPGALDGSENAAAILVEDVSVPVAGDEKALVYVHGLFRQAGLGWGSANAGQIATAVSALRALSIYVK